MSTTDSYRELSPREVVEAMSFQQQDAAKQASTSTSNSVSSSKLPPSSMAPAPSAPPPPPPPSGSDVESVRPVNLEDLGDDSTHDYNEKYNDNNPFNDSSSSFIGNSHYQQPQQPISSTNSDHSNMYNSGVYASSYQNTSSSSRAACVPAITNYGVSSVTTPEKNTTSSISCTMRGDASARPNTGQTNDGVGGIGSLREVASLLRWMTIGSTILAIIWEGFAFPTRLLVEAWIYPAKVVLGGYLGIFCLLLLGVELNAPLRENFGVLYHPLGRGTMLFLMSGMCFGILAAWWEALLGLAFLICGGGYVYAYLKYPEYRRWQDYNENQIWSDVRAAIQRRSIAWAIPGASDPSIPARGWHDVQQESQSLLHNV